MIGEVTRSAVFFECYKRRSFAAWGMNKHKEAAARNEQNVRNTMSFAPYFAQSKRRKAQAEKVAEMLYLLYNGTILK